MSAFIKLPGNHLVQLSSGASIGWLEYDPDVLLLVVVLVVSEVALLVEPFHKLYLGVSRKICHLLGQQMELQDGHRAFLIGAQNWDRVLEYDLDLLEGDSQRVDSAQSCVEGLLAFVGGLHEEGLRLARVVHSAVGPDEVGVLDKLVEIGVLRSHDVGTQGGKVHWALNDFQIVGEREGDVVDWLCEDGAVVPQFLGLVDDLYQLRSEGVVDDCQTCADCKICHKYEGGVEAFIYRS